MTEWESRHILDYTICSKDVSGLLYTTRTSPFVHVTFTCTKGDRAAWERILKKVSEVYETCCGSSPPPSSP